MDSKFPLLKPTRKTGGERFRSGQAEMDFTLLDFWQWAASDLVSNTGRGHLAEFIVARALGLGIGDVRREWDPYDLLMNEIKIEVKSAAYVQSWFQKKLSVISFNVPARRGYDPETNTVEPEPKRHADVYVFALLGRCRLDQFLFDRRQNPRHAHNKEIIDQVGANGLGLSTHVIQLETIE